MIAPSGSFSEIDVARHYDDLDPFYLDVWGEHVHHGLWASGRETQGTAVRQMVDLVAAEAEIQAGDHVCDIGAGYGATARHLARDYGSRVTALTLSRAQYEYARSVTPPNENLTFLHGDWLENDLPSDSFDAVVAIECASHMADPVRFVEEAARVMKEGGHLVICAWVASTNASERQIRLLLEPIVLEGRLANLSTAREYLERIERAGLSLQGFHDLTRQVRRTWPIAIFRTLVRLVHQPRYLRYLLAPSSSNRRFLLTMARLWLAYRTGAMRYCLFKAGRPVLSGGSLDS